MKLLDKWSDEMYKLQKPHSFHKIVSDCFMALGDYAFFRGSATVLRSTRASVRCKLCWSAGAYKSKGRWGRCPLCGRRGSTS